jgi:hypothetical protein
MCSALNQKFGDERGPSGLMAGAHAAPGITVEVLVKRNQVVPGRIVLEELNVAEHRASPLRIVEEDP